MIKNNLAKLMIDKNVKATKLAKDTGVARSTISKIVNNQTSKIDFFTLNALCSYLKITPQQFFDYIPIDFEYYIQFNDITIFKDANGFLTEKTVCDFDFIIDIKDHKNSKLETVSMIGHAKFDTLTITATIKLDYDTNADKEIFEHYQNEIDFSFYPIVKKEIAFILSAEITNVLDQKVVVQFDGPKNFMDTNFIPTL